MPCPILTVACTRCSTPIQRKNLSVPKTAYCTTCQLVRREDRRKRVILPCRVCGVSVTLLGRAGLERARNGRSYCGEEHKRQWEFAQQSAWASKVAIKNAAASSARMTARNPMRMPGVREKMRASLKARNHQPARQGGNGRALPVPHQRLWDALGTDWQAEYLTLTNRALGLPRAIKSDLALPALRLAVEVDGGSHGSLKVKERDARKTQFLVSSGWTVLRFTNREVMASLDRCVQTVTSTILRLRAHTPT